MSDHIGLTPAELAQVMLDENQEGDPFSFPITVGDFTFEVTYPYYGVACWYQKHGDYMVRGCELQAIAEFLSHHHQIPISPEYFAACYQYLTTEVQPEFGPIFVDIIMSRSRNNMHDAFNPIASLSQCVEADSAVRQIFIDKGFQIEPGEYKRPILTSSDELVGMMQLVLDTPHLLARYIAHAKDFLPYGSYVDYDWIGKTLQTLLPDGALVVDVGAGDGRNIKQMAEAVPNLRFLGIERQSMREIFRASAADNLQIVVADFLAAPIKNCSALIFGAVWGHQKSASALALAKQAAEVLMDGGYIFSSPQAGGLYGTDFNISVHQKFGDHFIRIESSEFGFQD